MYDGMHALETFHVHLLERMGQKIDSPIIKAAGQLAPLLYRNEAANIWFVPYDALP
jgi:hypothetical protein